MENQMGARLEDAVERGSERVIRVVERALGKVSPVQVNTSLDPRYHDWFLRHRVTEAELQEQRASAATYNTVFSIVVPLFCTPLDVFAEMVDSVKRQSYGKWQLVLVNASPDDGALAEAVAIQAQSDDRIVVVDLAENGGITANTNAGVAAATGDYVCFFDHDDLLEPNVLYEYARAIADAPDAGLLYCDEDKLDVDGRYVEPHLKPDFNIDLLRTNNYVCHLLCVRKSLLDEIGPNDPRYDGAQDHALTLRVTELTDAIVHVPKVLYHWRITPGSTASRDAVGKSVKSYANEAGRLAIQDHLDRLGVPGKVVRHRFGLPFIHEVDYSIEGQPLVSVVITGGSAAEARGCARSLEFHSAYDRLEVLDGPTAHVVRPADRVAAINECARRAQGEYLLFLDAGIRLVPEVSVNPVGSLLGLCQRSDVGAAGGKVLRPDNTVFQAGMVSRAPGCPPESANVGLSGFDAGYGNYNLITRDYSFASACFMMMHRGVFEGVGGFDERFELSQYDADFCMKLREAGYLVVYESRAVTRLTRKGAARLDGEMRSADGAGSDVMLLRASWPDFFAASDPLFNPNFSMPQFLIDHDKG